jgi:hypothetical protein
VKAFIAYARIGLAVAFFVGVVAGLTILALHAVGAL